MLKPPWFIQWAVETASCLLIRNQSLYIYKRGFYVLTWGWFKHHMGRHLSLWQDMRRGSMFCCRLRLDLEIFIRDTLHWSTFNSSFSTAFNESLQVSLMKILNWIKNFSETRDNCLVYQPYSITKCKISFWMALRIFVVRDLMADWGWGFTCPQPLPNPLLSHAKCNFQLAIQKKETEVSPRLTNFVLRYVLSINLAAKVANFRLTAKKDSEKSYRLDSGDIPKGSDFSTISSALIRKIQWINRRPRKKPNFDCPKSVSFRQIANFALATWE